MSYKTRLLQHLAAYRRESLGIAEPGTFTFRGRDVPVEHVLPKASAWLNIPEMSRPQVQAYVSARRIRLHRYFHHLNSSQAFALSLFVPFFEGGESGASALLAAMGQRSALSAWRAEDVPDPREATNLDASWTTADGRRTLCEVKLTESEFGIARDDASHRRKLLETYAPRLAGRVNDALLEPARFFASYQILRNVWHIAQSPSDHLVFLLPKAHRDLNAILEPVLGELGIDLRSRVHILHVEDVLGRLVHDPVCPAPLRNYATTLVAKYVPRTS